MALVDAPEFVDGKIEQGVYGWKYTLKEDNNRWAIEICLSATDEDGNVSRVDVKYSGEDGNAPEDDYVLFKSRDRALMYFGHLAFLVDANKPTEAETEEMLSRVLDAVRDGAEIIRIPFSNTHPGTVAQTGQYL